MILHQPTVCYLHMTTIKLTATVATANYYLLKLCMVAVVLSKYKKEFADHWMLL